MCLSGCVCVCVQVNKQKHEVDLSLAQATPAGTQTAVVQQGAAISGFVINVSGGGFRV